MYGADVVSVQQVREWCHDFVSGLGECHERGEKWPTVGIRLFRL